VFFLALTILVFSKHQLQPSYGGRSLSKLLATYENACDAGRVTQEEEIPLRFIGTNAVPWLLRWLENDTPDWKVVFFDKCNSIIYRINPKWVLSDTALDRQCRARYGFRILGTNAAFAVPELARMLTSSNDLASFHSAISLKYVGPLGWPVLLAALTNRDEKIWENICLVIQDLETNAAPAIPIIVRNLGDPELVVRRRAAEALVKLPIESATVVPALLKSLHDPDLSIRQNAIMALAQHESQATLAVPDLIQLLNDPVPYTRNLAGHALRRIDLEAYLGVIQLPQ